MKNTSNIAADLNLTQSLQRFEALVLSVLSLGKLDSWNGPKLRETEAELRQGALVLAGQCIALLLSKLSSSSQTIALSNEQIQGLRSLQSKGHGHRSLTITGMGNVTLRFRLPYGVQGSSKGIKGKLSHQWMKGSFYPFLAWLGLILRCYHNCIERLSVIPLDLSSAKFQSKLAG